MVTLLLGAACSKGSGPDAGTPVSPAAAVPPPPDPAVERGRVLAQSLCVSCHLLDGSGNAAANFPRLAGMEPSYLVKQLADFRSGARNIPVMALIAKGLTEGQSADLAAYYGQLPLPPVATTPIDAAQRALGERLAVQGAWPRGLPACFSCHAPGGVGIGVFPGLAGQHADYLAGQLRAWRSGARRNDPHRMMKAVADRLEEKELLALAAYLSQLSPDAAPVATAAAPVGDYRVTVPASPIGPFNFSPPGEAEIPDNEFGAQVRYGRDLFLHTQQLRGKYSGNGLSCVNCHLDGGRKPGAGPLWAAYPMYPAYRAKTQQVNTLEERLQGCFLYSMNGQAPPSGSKELTALLSYQFWMSTGAPTGVELPGRGYPPAGEPPLPPDRTRGQGVYAARCAVCHGPDGQGAQQDGRYVFPPLWGPDSFNWGAGMHRVNTAADFIRANMPLGQGGTLSAQEAWDVARFMNSHPRPGDPRFTGSVDQTDRHFHDENCAYGETLDGQSLGAPAITPPG
ncbi:MAG: c-type cytochrome [Myxococcota bacterium]|nr:c-type cytochrome [Myxococcota bacterium]